MTPRQTLRWLRGHDFYPPKQAVPIPALYGTETIPTADKVLHAHYSVGGCDWWIAEYNPQTGLAFGYANLNDPRNAEWGYIDLTEIEAIRVNGLWVVERDLNWTPTRVGNANLPGRNTA